MGNILECTEMQLYTPSKQSTLHSADINPQNPHTDCRTLNLSGRCAIGWTVVTLCAHTATLCIISPPVYIVLQGKNLCSTRTSRGAQSPQQQDRSTYFSYPLMPRKSQGAVKANPKPAVTTFWAFVCFTSRSINISTRSNTLATPGTELNQSDNKTRTIRTCFGFGAYWRKGNNTLPDTYHCKSLNLDLVWHHKCPQGIQAQPLLLNQRGSNAPPYSCQCILGTPAALRPHIFQMGTVLKRSHRTNAGWSG